MKYEDYMKMLSNEEWRLSDERERVIKERDAKLVELRELEQYLAQIEKAYNRVRVQMGFTSQYK
jgi:hypothetical protein